MKLFALILAALMVGACTGNPPQTLSYSKEKSKDVFDSGVTTSEKTVTKNPDGSLSTEAKTTTQTPPK